jgi:hypothetical protein
MNHYTPWPQEQMKDEPITIGEVLSVQIKLAKLEDDPCCVTGALDSLARQYNRDEMVRLMAVEGLRYPAPEKLEPLQPGISYFFAEDLATLSNKELLKKAKQNGKEDAARYQARETEKDKERASLNEAADAWAGIPADEWARTQKAREDAPAQDDAPNQAPATIRKSKLVLIRGSDVEPQELHWLWHGHLLRGSQELTTGLPGLGKSQVQCCLVACCTACLPWPDGTSALDEPVNVIMLTAEDSIAQGLVPRLMAAGADMKRVHIVQCIKRNNKNHQFLLSQDLLDLELAIEEVGNVGLVTIDPITAYMGGKMDSHKTTEVRSQLGPLKDLAERCDVAISTITHPAKNAGPRAIDHFIGSQAFIAAGRVGHGCFEETEVNEVTGEKKPTGRNLFAHVKHSMSVKMPTLAYRLEGDVEVATGIKTSHVIWDGEVDITADAAVAGAAASKGTVRTDEQKRAAEFLCEVLEDGPVSQKQVEEEGEQRGFSKKVLRTTRDKLGVVSKKAGFDAGWEWSLPPTKS